MFGGGVVSVLPPHFTPKRIREFVGRSGVGCSLPRCYLLVDSLRGGPSAANQSESAIDVLKQSLPLPRESVSLVKGYFLVNITIFISAPVQSLYSLYFPQTKQFHKHIFYTDYWRPRYVGQGYDF